MSAVEVKYLQEQMPDRTDSAFYCWGSGFETIATVTKGDRTFCVGTNGEMRINLPDGEIYRYTEDLLAAGIDTDAKLAELEKNNPDEEIWINNNWFEIYEVGEDGEWWEVYDSIEEGIAAATEVLSA